VINDPQIFVTPYAFTRSFKRSELPFRETGLCNTHDAVATSICRHRRTNEASQSNPCPCHVRDSSGAIALCGTVGTPALATFAGHVDMEQMRHHAGDGATSSTTSPFLAVVMVPRKGDAHGHWDSKSGGAGAR